MSFSEFETSLQNGQPIRLYQFQRGPIKWGYTTANQNITHQSITFRTIEGGISDDGSRQTENTSSDMLTLTVPQSLDVAQMYRVVAPGQTIHLTVFDLHYGDTGFLVSWMGFIVGVRFKDQISASIQCKNLSASLERTGLRKAWGRLCQHQLYSDACRVQRNSYKAVANIDRLDGVNLGFAPAAGKSNGYYAGGYIEWMSQYGLEQRGIESHTGDLLTIYGGTSELSVGQEIAAFAGCDRLFETCKSKFNNTINYGGSPHMPGKSPFDGTPVF